VAPLKGAASNSEFFDTMILRRSRAPGALLSASPRGLRLFAAGLLILLPSALPIAVGPAHALSEIKREELPAPATTPAPDDEKPEQAVPVPDPVAPAQDAEPGEDGGQEPADTTEPEAPDPGAAGSQDEDAGPVPDVLYDVEALPEPVQRMRSLILEATKTGDIEKLRPLIGLGDDQTQLSVTDLDSDPIEHLRSLAGDEGGQEILAILEEVLSAGYVHLDVGTPEELYVWPYFFAVPLDTLSAPQRVELFKIVTAGDYEEMKNFGAYIFYRVGITPEGRWAFFVAGE